MHKYICRQCYSSPDYSNTPRQECKEKCVFETDKFTSPPIYCPDNLGNKARWKTEEEDNATRQSLSDKG